MGKLSEHLLMRPGPNLRQTRFYSPSYRLDTPRPYLRTTCLSNMQREVGWYLTGTHFIDLIHAVLGGRFSYTTYLRCLLALIVRGEHRGRKLVRQLRATIKSHKEILVGLTERQGSMYLGDQIGLDVWGVGELDSLQFLQGTSIGAIT